MKGDQRREKQLEKMKAKATKEQTPEQLNNDRLATIEWLDMVIPTLIKEIGFKKAQLSTGNILEKNDNFIDGKKRDFEIEFEIMQKQKILREQTDQRDFNKKKVEEYDRAKKSDKTCS